MSSTTPASPPPATHVPGPEKRSPRIVFVDLLRLFAALQMINGHTLTGVLTSAVQQGPFFDNYSYGRGLVSVAFLMASGMAYHLSTLSRFERHKADPSRSRRRFRVAINLFLISYALGFPWGAFREDPDMQARAWFYFWRVDILQCIGFGILSMEAMTVLARRASHVVIACAVLAPLLLGLAPLTDRLIEDGQPHPLLNWVSMQGGSMFPILPFVGFLYCGVVVGSLALPRSAKTSFGRRVGALLGVAGVFGILWIGVERLPWSLYDADVNFASTSPVLSLEKLTWVTGILTVLAIASYRITRLPKLLAILASETLFIFVFQSFVIFGPGIGFSRYLDDLALLPSLGISAVMIVLTCTATVAWHRWKLRRRAKKEATAAAAA